jgi:hypothetical protein
VVFADSNLNAPGKLFAILAYGAASKLLQPTPSGGATAKAKSSLRFKAMIPDFSVVNHNMALNQYVIGFLIEIFRLEQRWVSIKQDY